MSTYVKFIGSLLLLVLLGGAGWGAWRLATHTEAADEVYSPGDTHFRQAFAQRYDLGDFPVLLHGHSPYGMASTAIEGSLAWLQDHQAPDGRWSPDGYVRYSHRLELDSPMAATSTSAEVYLTAGAMLCFLASGYDHRLPSRYQRVLKRAVAWLLAWQHDDGGWGETTSSALASLALSEAYGLTADRSLHGPAQRALDFLLRRQNPGDPAGIDRGGWSPDHPDPRRHDSFTTCWCTLALRSGKAAGLDVGQGLAGAKWWLVTAWRQANPAWEKLDVYQDDSRFPAVYDALAGEGRSEGGEVAAAMVAQMLGYHPGDPLLDTLVNRVYARGLPRLQAWPTDACQLYQRTRVIRVYDGYRWDKWRRPLIDLLLENQEAVDYAGSWNPTAAGDEHSPGHEHSPGQGRILTTIYGHLTFQCFHRRGPAP